MEEKIYSVLKKHKLSLKKREEVLADLLPLFIVSVNEVELICEHQHGMKSCGYKHKDVYTCKHLRNCEMCGN